MDVLTRPPLAMYDTARSLIDDSERIVTSK